MEDSNELYIEIPNHGTWFLGWKWLNCNVVNCF